MNDLGAVREQLHNIEYQQWTNAALKWLKEVIAKVLTACITDNFDEDLSGLASGDVLWQILSSDIGKHYSDIFYHRIHDQVLYPLSNAVDALLLVPEYYHSSTSISLRHFCDNFVDSMITCERDAWCLFLSEHSDRIWNAVI